MWLVSHLLFLHRLYIYKNRVDGVSIITYTICILLYFIKFLDGIFKLDMYAAVAQLVERVHGKDEVTSSILVGGSRVSTIYQNGTFIIY